MIKNRELDQNLYRSLTKLAIPMILQSVIGMALNLLDSVMVGGLGETELSAVSLGNQLFSLLSYFTYGLSAGSCTLISQYWGKGDGQAINRLFGISLTLSSSISLLFAAVGVFLPGVVMGLLTDLEGVRALGADYLRIVALSYVFTAVSHTFSLGLRGVERVKVPLFISTGAILVNTLLNWVLIYGKLGVPALGVEGAAIATVIARALECAAVLLYAFGFEKAIRLRLREMLRFNRGLFRDFARFCLPTMFNETFWGIGMTVKASIIGHLSEAATAAYSVTGTLESIGFMAVGAICNAGTVILGKLTGTRPKDEVLYTSRKLLKTGTAIAAAMVLVMVLISEPFLSLYTGLSEEAIVCARQVIWVMSAAFLFKCVNSVGGTACAQGTGDARFPLVLDSVTLWAVSLPLGLLGAHLGWPMPLLYFALTGTEALKTPFFWARAWSGKHIVNATRE